MCSQKTYSEKALFSFSVENFCGVRFTSSLSTFWAFPAMKTLDLTGSEVSVVQLHRVSEESKSLSNEDLAACKTK